MARYVMDQLIRFGEVRRGTLGIFVQDLTAELAGAFSVDAGQGVLVAELTPGSSAEDAGLRPGDIIVNVANNSIGNTQDFHNAEGTLAVGESLEIEFLREGKKREIALIIQEVPVIDGGDLDYRLAGVRFSGLSAKYKKQGIYGVLLDDLDPRSRLAREGFAEGDIITGVNRQQVRNLEEFKKAFERPRSSILLQLSRRGRTLVARLD
jgi:S1-C subfamily serine protease